MSIRTSLMASAALLFISSNATAAETQKYTYDAKGRLVKVERSGTINNNVDTEYEYDKANNRDRVKITGSSNSPPP